MATASDRYLAVIDADSGGAVKGMGQFDKAVEKSNKGFDKFSKSIGVSSKTMATGLADLGKIAIGGGILVGAQQMVGAFADAATNANLLAKATNANIEEASKFNTVAAQFGLEINDLIEIFADFQQAAAGNEEVLAEMGVAIAENADGTTDWIKTSVNFLEAVQDIGDATERNALLFQFFGEEGAKQIIGLVNSGLDLVDAMEQVAGVTEDDLKAAQDYNAAMRDLQGTLSETARDLGRTLAPAFTTAADALNKALAVIKEIPGPVLVMVGSFAALKKVMSLDLVAGALKGLQQFNAGLDGTTSKFGKAGAAAKKFGTALKATMVSNAPLLAIAAAITLITESIESTKNLDEFSTRVRDITKSLREQAEELRDTDSVVDTLLEWSGVWDDWLTGQGPVDDKMQSITASLIRQAQATLDSTDATEAQKTAAQDLLDIIGDGALVQQTANLATEEGLKAQQDYAASLSASEAAAQLNADAQRELADIIASGVTSQEEWASAVTTAATAQHEQEVNAKLQKDAIDGVIKSNWEAVDATLALTDKTYAARAAHRQAAQAVEDRNAIERKDGESKAEYARRVEAANDEIITSTMRAAAADQAAAEQKALLAGDALSVAEAHDVYLASLKEAAKNPDLTKKQRDEINKLIDDFETAQETAQEGIEIGGIRYKSGTTEKQVEGLKTEIDRAFATGQIDLATSLQKELDALKIPEGLTDVPPIPVTVVPAPPTKGEVDTATAPISAPIDAPVNPVPASDDAAEAARANLGAPVDVPVNYTVAGTSLDDINRYNDDLDGKILKVNVDYKVYGGSLDKINKYNDDLDNKLITIDVQYNKLNSIPTVPYNPPGPIGGWPLTGPSARAMSASQPIPFGGSSFGTGVVYAPQITNNYPKPERASDSIASSLRIARYMAGV